MVRCANNEILELGDIGILLVVIPFFLRVQHFTCNNIDGLAGNKLLNLNL